MKNISVYLNAIANGVIVTIGTPNEAEFAESQTQHHYPSWDDAIAALPKLIERARMDPRDYLAKALERRFATEKPSPDPVMSEVRESKPYVTGWPTIGETQVVRQTEEGRSHFLSPFLTERQRGTSAADIPLEPGDEGNTV